MIFSSLLRGMRSHTLLIASFSARSAGPYVLPEVSTAMHILDSRNDAETSSEVGVATPEVAKLLMLGFLVRSGISTSTEVFVESMLKCDQNFGKG